MEHDDRIRLNVIGLSYSKGQSGVYALILRVAGSNIHIPIIIGAPEAQAIITRMEGMTLPRPLTHDLFASFSHAFGITLEDVFIYKFEDGIFSSELTFTNGDRTVKIDSRTSDAIAIAMRTGAPIYTTQAIVDETGFEMEQQEGQEPAAMTDDTPREAKIENYTIGELERTLEQLTADEEYEQASKVAEILRRKRANANHSDENSNTNTETNQQ